MLNVFKAKPGSRQAKRDRLRERERERGGAARKDRKKSWRVCAKNCFKFSVFVHRFRIINQFNIYEHGIPVDQRLEAHLMLVLHHYNHVRSPSAIVCILGNQFSMVQKLREIQRKIIWLCGGVGVVRKPAWGSRLTAQNWLVFVILLTKLPNFDSELCFFYLLPMLMSIRRERWAIFNHILIVYLELE